MQVEIPVRCDRCGAEIEKERALVAQTGDNSVYYFCTVRCLEEKDYTPEREEPADEIEI